MYQGHMNDGSSIQKHSAGPLYPFVVYETHGGAMHLLHPSGQAVAVPTRLVAEQVVEQYRMLAANGARFASARAARWKRRPRCSKPPTSPSTAT